jgi:hypothetical protein
MYVMSKELVISVGDLRYLSVDCAHCKTNVTVDLGYKPPPPQAGELAPEQVVPLSQCPTCRNLFDSRIPENIDSLRAIYLDLVKHKVQVSFRVRTEE